MQSLAVECAYQTLALQDPHILLLCRIDGRIKVLIRKLPSWLKDTVVEGNTTDIYIDKRYLNDWHYHVVYKDSIGNTIDTSVILVRAEAGKWWKEEVLETNDTDISNFSNKFIVCSVRVIVCSVRVYY